MAEGDMAYFPDKEGLTQAREDISLLALFDAEGLWDRFEGSILEKEKIYTRERADLWAGYMLQQHFDTLLKYKTSWDWQAPIWQKLNKLVRNDLEKFVPHEGLLRQFFMFQGAWQEAMVKNDKDVAFSTTITAVKWYLQMKDVVSK